MRLAPFIALASIALLLPVAAGAQALGGLGGGASTDPLSLSVTPQYPAPYGQVSITPSSLSLNLTDATMTVYVGGEQTYTGAAHTFSVQLGAGGTTTNVVVKVSAGGAVYSESVSTQPEDVVLIAEPVASVPPLYPGEPSVPLEGNVRIVAMANLRDTKGNSSSPTGYSYDWTVNGIEMSDSSGIGKSSIIVPSPLEYRDGQVSVVVMNTSGTLVSGASLSFTAVEPTARIYEDDPLLGIRYNHALSGSYTISGTEATLYAAPFSLPITSGAPVVQWFLNGAPAQTGNSITLRPAGSGQGSASLSFVAPGGGTTSATASLSLLFNVPKSTNLFGL